ncbi:MAG: hypothetical protein IJ875_07060, partial [Solobacterium sp.]|nr:hypothetical protein [Solobacterium sp.]
TIDMQAWHAIISWISVIMGIGLYIYADRKNPNRQMIFHSRKSLILFIIGCVSVVLITFLLMN